MQSNLRSQRVVITQAPLLMEAQPYWLLTLKEEETIPTHAKVPDYAFSKEWVDQVEWHSIEAVLLDIEVQKEEWNAAMVVIEPTQMIEISALAESSKSYGFTAYNHLFSKLQPQSNSQQMLVGNVANYFFDKLIHATDPQEINFQQTMKEYFAHHSLEVVLSMRQSSTQEEIAFFQQCELQFNNLKQVIFDTFQQEAIQIERSSLIIEPTFYSPLLGVQGRLDAMSNDYSSILELKSGKGNEWNGRIKHQENHYIQMLLYFALLRQLPHSPSTFVRAFLLYSRYPLLIPERPSFELIDRAIGVRNDIVLMELILRQQQSAQSGLSLLLSLNPDQMNPNQAGGKLWSHYVLPTVAEFQRRLHRLPEVEQLYLGRILTFIANENYAARNRQQITPEGCIKNYNSWLATDEEKRAEGELLGSLVFDQLLNEGGEPCQSGEPVDALRLRFRPEELASSSFREGDMVLLYPQKESGTSATDQYLFRASIATISDSSLIVQLSTPQRDHSLWSSSELYCIEQNRAESSLNSTYRGISSFLRATPERRKLLIEGPSLLPSQVNTSESKTATIVRKASQAKELFLLVGPPGTGKTSVAMRAMVLQFLSEGKAVLMLSYTNRAIDEICQMLETISDCSYLRIGNPLSCDPAYRHRLFEQQAQNRNRRSECDALIEQTPIFVGTVSSISNRMELLRHKKFGVAIIDEATQIVESQLLSLFTEPSEDGISSLIPKFILIGDPKQLPGVVAQPSQQSYIRETPLLELGVVDLRESIFERLFRRLKAKKNTAHYDEMEAQGRMHPDVAQFANDYFYGGKLRPVPLPHQQKMLFFEKTTDHPLSETIQQERVLFFDVRGNIIENDKNNPEEAQMVAQLAKTLFELYRKNEMPFSSEKSIGIITPFRSQVATIREAITRVGIEELNSITIDTVERYQGSQRDVIIYSLCINRAYQLEQMSSLVRDGEAEIDRKLNVALTRAKEHLLLIGNRQVLSRNALFNALINRYLTTVNE